MRKIAVPVIAGLALLGVAGSSAHAAVNLVVNPGFEICTGAPPIDPDDEPPTFPSSWTATGNVPCQNTPHSGQTSANMLAHTNTLSQAISTIAGDNYDFSFWLQICVDSADTFAASFGGTEVLSVISDGDFITYALEEFTVTATAPVTTIGFTGVVRGGFWGIDDVSVTDLGPATAPEPASLALLGTALTGFATLRQRRRNARRTNAARAAINAV
jgi:hypothetical protein